MSGLRCVGVLLLLVLSHTHGLGHHGRAGTSASPRLMLFVCSPSNDVWQLLQSTPAAPHLQRFDSIEGAFTQCHTPNQGGALFVLADGYPSVRVGGWTLNVHKAAQACRLRSYIEFPSFIPGLGQQVVEYVSNLSTHTLQGPLTPLSHFVRLVTNTTSLSAYGLSSGRILQAHGTVLAGSLTVQSAVAAGAVPLVVAAQVAGYDHTVYPLPPPATAWPLLFTVSAPQYNDQLISYIQLSNLQRARYAPAGAFDALWSSIFDFCSPEFRLRLSPGWQPSVSPLYGPLDQLPADWTKQMVSLSLSWLSNRSGLLYSGMVATDPKIIAGHCPTVTNANLTGGVTCIDEGLSSVIDSQGNQTRMFPESSECSDDTNPSCSNTRTDDNAQSAVGFAAGAALLRARADATSPLYADVATGIVRYVYNQSGAHLTSGSPFLSGNSSGARGLVVWFTNTWYVKEHRQGFYGDNDGTVLLSSIVVAGLQKDARWNRAFVTQLFGNIRTQGVYGFREPSTSLEDMNKVGWQPFFNGTRDEHQAGSQPHYQANLWAAFLWGYRVTGNTLFLKRTVTALARLMAIYPEQWRWTEYLSEELAHMLLPLSFLYRVQPTEQVRGWIDTIATALMERQRPCGAVREYLGTPGLGNLPPPASNEAYGKGEGSLIQEDSDPVADLLYTQNFAVMSMHEAAAATGDVRYHAFTDKLLRFFARVQVGPSRQHPDKEGLWYRAVDVDKWEYWGMATDWAYGPWETENGWTIGWVTATASLRALNSSFWDAAEWTAESIRNTSLVEDVCLQYLPSSFC